MTAAAGTLTGGTLASGVTASSLASFGASPTLVTPTIESGSGATDINCTFSGGSTFPQMSCLTTNAASGLNFGIGVSNLAFTNDYIRMSTQNTGTAVGPAILSSGGGATTLELFSGNGGITLGGLTSGSQTSCLGLTSGGVLVGSGSACGSGGSGLTVGTTTIASGTNGHIEYNNSGVLGELATTGSGSVVLASAASTTVNGQTCSLGGTCTAAAAAGTLTGSTLASGVTASSLTSFGASSTIVTPTIESGSSATDIACQYVGGATFPQFSCATDNAASNLNFGLGIANTAFSNDYIRLSTQNNGTSVGPVILSSGGGASTLELFSGNGGIEMNGISNASGNEILCYAASNGQTTYESSVAGCVPSDPKLKNIERNINPFVAMIKVGWYLNTGVWTFKDAPRFGDAAHIGLYADQVCKMDNRLCIWDHEGVLNYDKVGFAAYLLAALKGVVYSVLILFALVGAIVVDLYLRHRKVNARFAALEARVQ